MNYFAKFEKFIPHSISIPSFMTIGSQMPELDRGDFLSPPPYKIGSQNTPYKLGLSNFLFTRKNMQTAFYSHTRNKTIFILKVFWIKRNNSTEMFSLFWGKVK